MSGLVHLGVLYDDVADLAARCLPEIRAVLDEGGDVRVTVERGGVRELREALGPDADRVTFPAPLDGFSQATPAYLEALRRTLPRDRRTLLVGQYSTRTPASWDSGLAEDAVNLMLADVPLTVLCACERTGPAGHRALTERSHRHLLERGGRRSNAAFRDPDPVSPAPLRPWGPPGTTVRIADAAGLAELRRRVAEAAADVGLVGEAREAAVLAAHEAVLLASGPDADTALPIAGERFAEVRARDGAVVVEVVSERAASSAPAAPGSADWRRAVLPAFCSRLATYDGGDGRRVRVLSCA